MTDETPKILEGEPVVFGESTAQADTLEDIVSTPNNNTSPSINNTLKDTVVKLYGQETFDSLVASAKEFISHSSLLSNIPPTEIEHFFPLKFHISYMEATGGKIIESYYFDPMTLEDLKPILVNHFGSDYVFKTDFAKTFPEIIDFRKMNVSEQLFPMIKGLDLKNFGHYSKFFDIISLSLCKSPFAFMFLVEPNYRPLLSKSMLLSIKAGYNLIAQINNKGSGSNYPTVKNWLNINPLIPTRYIVKCAEEEGLIDICEYIDAVKPENLFKI